MLGKFLDMSNSLVNTFVFPRKNFILYLVLLVNFSFIPTRSTISLWTSFVYLRELPIFKGEVGVLDFF